MRINAGFFPCEKSYLKRFTKIMLEDIKQIDILVSWRPEEIFFQKSLRKSFRIGLADLVPSNDQSFWTHELKGKHVLVIHPFAESIEKQYKNREKLFDNPDTLPELASLRTIKAVQTIAGNSMGFGDWFEALEHMKQEIDKHDFDVALTGCGAYGLPLAAYIKRKGKKSIHMGGSLQLLFGIKGKRWDNSPLYNEHWTSPSASERPANLNMVENGCYW